MTETPSGNRWEPADAGTQPLRATPAAAPEYGWVPAPQPAAPAPSGRDRRRTGLLAAGAVVLLLGSGATGYAIGSATAGSAGPDVGTTRQVPGGFTPGQGFPGPGGSDGRDQFGGPGGDPDGGSP